MRDWLQKFKFNMFIKSYSTYRKGYTIYNDFVTTFECRNVNELINTAEKIHADNPHLEVTIFFSCDDQYNTNQEIGRFTSDGTFNASSA